MKFADLHLHTVFSDGTYTLEELVEKSLGAGLSAIAVVDHDTTEGILPTRDIARQRNIELIPGIELTAEYIGLEIHILGYLIDCQDKAFLEQLGILKRNRIERIYKITDKLKKIGIPLSAEAVFDIAKGGTTGRLHVARAMVKQGLVGSIFEAFKKYIGDKCPAYCLGFRFSPEQAIKLIKDAGGIAVLAHPYALNDDALIPKFIDYGLEGLEVYYPEHSPSMTKSYLGLAKKYNLLATGGSDCHGEAKPEVRIGSIKLPYELVEELKARKENG